MLKALIKKEVHNNLLSSKFIYTFLLCSLMILFSVILGINRYQADMEEYYASIAINKANLDAQPDYPTLASLGLKVSRPPSVLSIIVSGIDDYMGKSSKVTIAIDPVLEESRVSDSPIIAVFGNLDLTYIVSVILSLFALLFTYDAIIGEKENGTLKLLLAHGVTRDKLIFGKIIGGYLSIVISLTIPLLITLIIFSISPRIELNSEDWIRICVIYLFYYLYISVFFFLGLFISSKATSSSASLFILLFIWVFFVVLVPRISISTINQAIKVPTQHEIAVQKEAFLQEIQGNVPNIMNEWFDANKELQLTNPNEYNAKYKEFLEETQNQLAAKIDKKNKELEDEYQVLKSYQTNVSSRFSKISPTSCSLPLPMGSVKRVS